MKSISDYLLNEDTVQNEYTKYSDKYKKLTGGLSLTTDDFKNIVDADPTARNQYTGKYTGWLVFAFSQLSQSGQRRFAEDVPRYKEALVKYDKLKKSNKLDPNERDIMKFGNIQEIYKIVDRFNEIDFMDPAELKSQYQVVLKATGSEFDYFGGDAYYVVTPFTKAASCHLGANTHWCTAGSERNAFDTYFDDSPEGRLYIIIKADEDGKMNVNTIYKWQIHPKSQQFMDYLDKPAFDVFTYLPIKIREFVCSVWPKFPISIDGDLIVDITLRDFIECAISKQTFPIAYWYSDDVTNPPELDDTYDHRKIENILDYYEDVDPDYYQKLIDLVSQSIQINTARLHGNYELARHIYEGNLDEKVFNNAFRLSVKYNVDYQYNLVEAYYNFIEKAFENRIVDTYRNNSDMLAVITNIRDIALDEYSFDDGRPMVYEIENIVPDNEYVDLQFNDTEYFSDEVFRNWSPV
jgi:hypothetical protein